MGWKDKGQLQYTGTRADARQRRIRRRVYRKVKGWARWVKRKLQGDPDG